MIGREWVSIQKPTEKQFNQWLKQETDISAMKNKNMKKSVSNTIDNNLNQTDDINSTELSESITKIPQQVSKNADSGFNIIYIIISLVVFIVFAYFIIKRITK